MKKQLFITLVMATMWVSMSTYAMPEESKTSREDQEEKLSVNFLDAVKNGDVAGVKEALKACVDVDSQNDDGITALALAAINGHTDIVGVLMEAKADVNAYYPGLGVDKPPLYYAAREGHTKIVQLLLNAPGIRVDSCGYHVRISPLHAAVQAGHTDIVRLLLDARANTCVTNDKDLTPLHLVAQYGHAHMVPLLVYAGADCNVKSCFDITPLNTAILDGHRTVVKALLRVGVAVDKKSFDMLKKKMSDVMTELRDELCNITTQKLTAYVKDANSNLPPQPVVPLPIAGGHITLFNLIAHYATDQETQHASASSSVKSVQVEGGITFEDLERLQHYKKNFVVSERYKNF